MLRGSKAVSRLLRQRGIHAPRLSRKRKLEPQPEAKPENKEEVDEEYTPTEAPMPLEEVEVKEDEPMAAEEPVERTPEPHEIPAPEDDGDWEDETWEEAARQEWQQEDPERRRQRPMDDVPISIKRKLTEKDAGLPNKRPRIHASWIVQAMTAAAASGPANECVSGQELETLKKLTGLSLSAARIHRKPRKRLMRPPKAVSRSRLSILVGEDPMDAFVVDEDEGEVAAAPKRKVAFYWKGMTMLYKKRGRKPQATYVQLPTGVYKACLGPKDRREFEQLWLEELRDVLVNEVMLLKLKQNGKELDPRWFSEQEKKAFDLSDAKEWEQWLNNEVAQKVLPEELREVPRHQIFKAPSHGSNEQGSSDSASGGQVPACGAVSSRPRFGWLSHRCSYSGSHGHQDRQSNCSGERMGALVFRCHNGIFEW